ASAGSARQRICTANCFAWQSRNPRLRLQAAAGNATIGGFRFARCARGISAALRLAQPLESRKVFCRLYSKNAEPVPRLAASPRCQCRFWLLPAPTSSADALAQRRHIGADACGIDAVVAGTFAAGRSHVDSTSDLVADNSDDDIIGEAKPTALLASFDTAGIG